MANDNGVNTAPSAATKTVVETVTMSDGRKVDFAGKRRTLKSSGVTEDGKVWVRIDVRDGNTFYTVLPPELLLRFAAHGAEQKFGDELATPSDKPLSDEDIILTLEDLNERIQRGEWSVKREGGGLGGTSILLRALVEVSGKSRDEIKAFLKDKSHAEKTALRANSKIKPVVERLEAEKAARSQGAAKVDTAALLGGLGIQ